MQYIKTIKPERDGRNVEYRAELNHELVGYYRNFSEAERALDELVYELLQAEAAAASTIAPLPSVESFAAVAAEHADGWREVGSDARARSFDKAAWHYHQGVRPQPTHGGYLIPSGTRSGTIHRYSEATGKCTCETSQAGRDCWHVAMVRTLVLCEVKAQSVFLP